VPAAGTCSESLIVTRSDRWFKDALASMTLSLAAGADTMI